MLEHHNVCGDPVVQQVPLFWLDQDSYKMTLMMEKFGLIKKEYLFD